MTKQQRSRSWHWAVSWLVYALASVLMTWPLVGNLDTHLAGQDASAYVLPTDAHTEQDYRIAHRFSNGTGLVRPIVVLDGDDDAPALRIYMCWLRGKGENDGDQYTITMSGQKRGIRTSAAGGCAFCCTQIIAFFFQRNILTTRKRTLCPRPYLSSGI